jgi:hypothetical protein
MRKTREYYKGGAQLKSFPTSPTINNPRTWHDGIRLLLFNNRSLSLLPSNKSQQLFTFALGTNDASGKLACQSVR